MVDGLNELTNLRLYDPSKGEIVAFMYSIRSSRSIDVKMRITTTGYISYWKLVDRHF